MSGVSGQRKRAPLAADQARQRMWNSMRMLRRFTAAEVEATSESGQSHAGKYIRALVAASYLRIAQPKREGIPGGHAVYQLVRDSGPHAPRIGKDGLHDPNLQHTPVEMVRVRRDDYERAKACVRACAGMENPEAEIARLRAAAGVES